MQPTQPAKYSAMFLRHFVPWPSADLRAKFYGDRPSETPLSGLNAIRAKYSNVGHLKGYISETEQDKASGTINDYT